MKTINGVLLGAGLILANILHAQTTVESISASDLSTMLEAVEQTTPEPATNAPFAGNFYSAQHAPGTENEWPPLPGNVNHSSVWSLGGDVFLLSDLDYNYDAPLQTKALRRRSLSALDLSPQDDGDDDTNSVEMMSFLSTPIATNGLWLEITNVANGLAYLNIHHATNKVYEIWSKTDLTLTNWNIENEVFPGINTNVMPFTVSQLNRTNLFLWARDWTGITSDGNTTPEWWFYEFYGTVALSDTNLDSQGNTLLDDYWNGLDPNIIQFSVQFTNIYVNTTNAQGAIIVSNGVPSYMAVLVNNTNFTTALWQPYDSNVVATLSSGDGKYDVWVGLRGLPDDASQSWQWTPLTLDTIPPVLTVTNPTTGTVSQPMIQLQGFANESLSSLTFDVSNAAGLWTNQTGYVTGQFSDTNVFAFTTNYFQGYDIALTNGLNRITLHATDLAGNTATTNANFTLDYSGDTNPPALSLVWPTNGTSISGSNFTVQAQIDDPTATVMAQIVDASGNTNVISGLVEQSGQAWVGDLPLGSGTNIVTVTAMDAAGNSSVTNFNIVRNDVGLTINPLTSDQLNQYLVDVSGTVGDSNDVVTVNGVSATVNGDGTWAAVGVPVNPADNAGLNVQVSDMNNNPIAAQSLIQPQPSLVQVSSWQYQFHQMDVGQHFCDGSVTSVGDLLIGSWIIGVGGYDEYEDLLATNDPPAAPWQYDSDYDSTEEFVADDETSHCNGTGTLYITRTQNTRTELQLVAGGAVVEGVQRLIRLTVSVMSGDVTVPLPAISLLGQVPTPTATNANVGEVWASVAAGSVRSATPAVTGFKSYTADIQANDVQLISQCVATTPSDQSRTNLGVGEQVNLSFNPTLPTNAIWSTTAGGLAVTSGMTNLFTAPSNAANVTVTATIGNAPVNFYFKVLEPSTETSIISSTETFPAGTEGVGMNLTVIWGPTNVSLNRVQIIEVPGPASNITGCFTNYPSGALDHHPNTNWVTLSSDNETDDEAAISGVPQIIWYSGGFDLDIPVLWKVIGGSITNAFPHDELQSFRMTDTNGTTTVSKLGSSTTRTP